MYLRGRDLDTFLLAGICNVGNGSALYVALPAQIVELDPAVHRTAIVPHDEVVYPPAMGVNELPLCRVPDGQKGGPLNFDGFELLPHALGRA